MAEEAAAAVHTEEEAVASTQAEEAAVPEGDLRPQGPAIRAGCLARPRVPTAIRSVEAKGRDILRLPVRPIPAANGVRLAAHLEAADLKRLNPERHPRPTQAAGGMSSARIAERDLPGRFAAFQAKVAKSGRTLPSREMLFRGLNRFPPCTVRLTHQPRQIPRPDRTRPSPPHRTLPVRPRSWAIEDFRVA